MAGAFVGGALLEAGFGELLKAVVAATKKACGFKSKLNGIASILRCIIPIIKKIEAQNQVLDRTKETDELMEIIEEGKEVVNKCSRVSRWDYRKRINYTNKLVELEKKLKDYFQIVTQAQQMRGINENSLKMDDLHMGLRRLSRNENFGSGGYGPDMGSSALPGAPPAYTVGLDAPLRELKMELFKDESSVIVLTAPGGCGKTTLAKMVCSDDEVKDSEML